MISDQTKLSHVLGFKNTSMMAISSSRAHLKIRDIHLESGDKYLTEGVDLGYSAKEREGLSYVLDISDGLFGRIRDGKLLLREIGTTGTGDKAKPALVDVKGGKTLAGTDLSVLILARG